MKTESIILKWVEDGKKYIKEIDRQSFFKIMDGIRQWFFNDNEISTRLCNEVIPYANTIIIDKDRNMQKDVPFIQYKIGDDIKVVEIIRHHKIIWALLDWYCQT